MKTILKLATVALAAGLTGSASALTLTLQDIVNPSAAVNVVDNGAGDISATANHIVFFGSAGQWTLNTETGTSGTPNGYPIALSLTSSNTSSSSSGADQTLKITLSDTGYNAAGALLADLAFNPSPAQVGFTSIVYEVWKNATLLTSITAPSLAALTDTEFLGTMGPLDTLTQVVYVTHKHSLAGTQTVASGFKADASVPEGGMTAALLGLGLLATGFASRRRKLV